MQFGVCYYPEQWPAERVPTDVGSMKELGLELVRVGEFAWSTFEPSRDEFNFAWLDRVLTIVSEHEMDIVLCTPTATPPVWLVRERPDVLAVGSDGSRRPYGSRRHTCTTSAAYREESERIVSALLDRYGSLDRIVAWQVDNELGNHDSARCWCAECSEAFRAWLAARYGTIEALNDAWGTSFWSMTYPRFEAVELPRPTMTTHNPSLVLAQARFASDQSIDFARAQADQIRAVVGSDVVVTTNFYSEDTAVDQRAAAAIGGVSAIDNYPHGPADPMVTAYHHDLNQTQRSSWVMEQQIGPINWTETNPAVDSGKVRAWVWQAALHGTDVMLFFRWRATLAGQEQWHSAVLRHDGSKSRVWDELCAVIGEIKDRRPLVKPNPRVALIHEADDVWTIDATPLRVGDRHRSLQMGAYSAARRLGEEVAVVGADSDLTSFDIVMAPAATVVTAKRVAALRAALASGTEVLLGSRSLMHSLDATRLSDPTPAGLVDVLGAHATDHLSLGEPMSLTPWGVDGGDLVDVLAVVEADVVASFGGSGVPAGEPAVVRSGNLTYVGVTTEDAWLAVLSPLLDATPDRRTVETFVRGDETISIDHRVATVEFGDAS